MYRAIVVFLAFLSVNGWHSDFSSAGEEPLQVVSDKRLPAPNADAQKQAKRLVQEIFGSRLTEVGVADQKLQLAKDLLRLGTETNDDMTNRFVLYAMARDMASESGDWETFASAIRRLEEEYQVDNLAIKLDFLSKAVKAHFGAKAPNELNSKLSDIIKEAIAQDRYEVAKRANALLLQWVQRTRDVEAAKESTALGQELIRFEAEYSKAKSARELLKSHPTDTGANAILGRYQCIMKGDWENGLPFLAKGNDKSLAQLAADELLESPDALQMGDAWWNLAQTLKGRDQEIVQEHARSWYRRLPPQTGLMKARLDSRLGNSPDSTTTGPVSAKSMPSSLAASPKISYETGIKEALESTERIGGNLQSLIKEYTSDAIPVGGHHYKLFKEVVTWNEAKDICSKLGGHLLVLENKIERNEVSEINKIGMVWIGASFNQQGEPVWVNGAPFNFVMPQTDSEYKFIGLNQLNFMRGCNSAGKATKGGSVIGFICEWEKEIAPGKKLSENNSTTKPLVEPPKSPTPTSQKTGKFFD